MYSCNESFNVKDIKITRANHSDPSWSTITVTTTTTHGHQHEYKIFVERDFKPDFQVRKEINYD